MRKRRSHHRDRITLTHVRTRIEDNLLLHPQWAATMTGKLAQAWSTALYPVCINAMAEFLGIGVCTLRNALYLGREPKTKKLDSRKIALLIRVVVELGKTGERPVGSTGDKVRRLRELSRRIG